MCERPQGGSEPVLKERFTRGRAAAHGIHLLLVIRIASVVGASSSIAMTNGSYSRF